MADAADEANDVMQVLLGVNMAYRKQEVQLAGGVCHNCEAAIDPIARWCDADCRADWEKRNPRPERRRREVVVGALPLSSEEPSPRVSVSIDDRIISNDETSEGS